MEKADAARTIRLIRVPEIAALIDEYAVSLGMYGAAWEALHAALGPRGDVLLGEKGHDGALAAVPASVMARFTWAEAVMLRSLAALDDALTIPCGTKCPHRRGVKHVRGRRRTSPIWRRTNG